MGKGSLAVASLLAFVLAACGEVELRDLVEVYADAGVKMPALTGL